MADEIKAVEGAERSYLNISQLLQRITAEQATQLDQLEALNVQSSILAKVQKTHLTDQQRLESLQTNIAAKSARLTALEIRRQEHLARGGARGLAVAAGLVRVQQDMIRQVEQLNVEHDRLLAKMAAQTVLMELAVKTGFKALIDKSREFREAWTTHPILGIGKILLHMIDVFDQMDQAAAAFRMNMGFTREYTKTIDANAREIAFNFAHVGVNAKIAYEATAALSRSLFSSMSASKELVTDVALMSAQLGISAGTSAEFMKNMGMASRTTASAQADMTLFAAKMTQAAGVPLGEVMMDVSNAMKNSYSFIVKSGLQLIKASVDAKRMGTSLESAAKTSEKLLDFTSSVRAEMEASVLVGKSVNLQHARELAYRRDMKGLNAEILRIMKDTNFENLDPFQQEAVARALGKSSGELAQMAQAERERLGWETSTDPIVQSQLRAYKEMEAATESAAKTAAADMRTQLQRKANQAAIASITQSWNAILQRIAEVALPAIDFTLKLIAKGVGWINTAFGWVNAKLGTFGKILTGLTVIAGLLVGPKLLGKLVSWAAGGIGRAIGNTFSSILGGIARGVGRFGTSSVLRGALGIAAVGAALIPFAFAMKLMTGIEWKTLGIAAVALGLLTAATLALGLLLTGPQALVFLIAAAGIAILGAALIPFAYAANLAAKAIKMLADVDIPKIAMGLGLLGVAIMPLAMVTPLIPMMAIGLAGLSVALRLLAGPAERVGQSIMNVGLGLKMTAASLAELQNLSLIKTVLQVRSLASAITELSKAIKEMPDLKVEKLKALVVTGLGAGGEGGGKAQSSAEILSAIKDGIDGLRNDMKSGALTANVYLDSQKLDAGMSRKIKFAGSLAT
jgi:hypothetical protein